MFVAEEGGSPASGSHRRSDKWHGSWEAGHVRAWFTLFCLQSD